jgi:CBS-domain-containing membrane protein
MENQQREFTDAEIQEKKAEMISFFKEQSEILEVQKNYETLLTEIEELRARRAMANMRIAQIMAPPPETDEESEEKPTKSRTLKKDK